MKNIKSSQIQQQPETAPVWKRRQRYRRKWNSPESSAFSGFHDADEKRVEKGVNFNSTKKIMFVKLFLRSSTSEGPFLRSSMTFFSSWQIGAIMVFFFSSFWCLSNDTMWIPAWQPVCLGLKYINTYRAPFQFTYNFIVSMNWMFLRFMGVQIIILGASIPLPRMPLVHVSEGWSWDLQDDCCWRGITIEAPHRIHGDFIAKL